MPGTTALLQLTGLSLVLAGFYRLDHCGPRFRKFYWTVAFATVVLGLAHLALFIAIRIRTPVEWDFLNYWLAGSIAAQDLPLYEARSYLRQALPFTPSEAFYTEVIAVGTMYAPPAVLMFLPLGYFDYYAAFVLWSCAQAAVLAGVIVLMKREFVRDGGKARHVAAWAGVICLAIFFPPVQTTFYHAQLNIVMALLFMLVWRFRRAWPAGVWIGAGMCVKPWFGILFLWLLLRRRFGALVLAVFTMALAFGVSALLIGTGDLVSYFTDNPVARAPAHLYTQDINQSALAILRRAGNARQWSGSPLLYGPYIAFASIVTALTAWSILYCRDDRWSLAACIALGLLIAPQSLQHYSAALLPIIAYMALGTGFRALGPIAAVSLFALSWVEDAGFWVNLGVWTIAASCPWWHRSMQATAGIRAASIVADPGQEPR